MSENLVSPNELVLSHTDQSLNCTTFVLDCRNHQAPLTGQLGINCSNLRLSDVAKCDSERLLYPPPASGPRASRSLNWCFTSAGGCGILNFCDSPNSIDTNTENEDSELWKKRVKTKLGCKRKATEPLTAISQVPTKVFINEKQISSCLGRLSLDNNNLDSHPDLEEEPWFNMEVVPRRSQSEVNFASLLDRVNSNQNSKLVLYHGLQLGLERRPVLPSLVPDEIKKPLMQVILWKPPGGSIKSITENLGSSGSEQQSFVFGQASAAATQFVFSTPVRLPDAVESNSSKVQTSVAVESGTVVKDGQDMDTEDW